MGCELLFGKEAKKLFPDLYLTIEDAVTITGLVFSKLARLARNTRELLDFADVFRACNADMISLRRVSTPPRLPDVCSSR